jgi:hypothetical protein
MGILAVQLQAKCIRACGFYFFLFLFFKKKLAGKLLGIFFLCQNIFYKK